MEEMSAVEGQVVDQEALAAWIAGLPVDGAVPSWVHPTEPGYPYDEAAALWLSWAAWRGVAVPDALVDTLRGALVSGGLGRAGQRYVFDSCLAVHALARAGVPFELDAALATLERCTEVVHPVRRPDHWSERWTGHLARGAALLLQAARVTGSDRAARLARSLRARATEPTQGYVHALAYATEGELLFRALGEPAGALDPRDVAATFAALQHPDGTLPAWDDGREPTRLDATAQAVRIWCVVDRKRHADAIDAALGALGRWQHPSGGMAYDPRGHVNSWASMFADQAVGWARDGVDGRGWI